jgi:hypothetical protein
MLLIALSVQPCPAAQSFLKRRQVDKVIKALKALGD